MQYIENKYYLYRHIRLDKNELFYIGIGTKGTKFCYYKTEYSRAFNTNKRNKVWKYIFNKAEIEVEILLESNDYDFIKKKEIEFIKLYGRINLGTGSLTNLTDGGDGSLNRKVSEEQKSNFKNIRKNKYWNSPMSEEGKEALSKSKLGVKRTQETIDKKSLTLFPQWKRDKIIEMILNGNTNQYIAKELKVSSRNVAKIKNKMDLPIKYVVMREDGIKFITEADACRTIGVSKHCIYKCIADGWKCGGYNWIKLN